MELPMNPIVPVPTVWPFASVTVTSHVLVSVLVPLGVLRLKVAVQTCSVPVLSNTLIVETEAVVAEDERLLSNTTFVVALGALVCLSFRLSATGWFVLLRTIRW